MLAHTRYLEKSKCKCQAQRFEFDLYQSSTLNRLANKVESGKALLIGVRTRPLFTTSIWTLDIKQRSVSGASFLQAPC